VGRGPAGQRGEQLPLALRVAAEFAAAHPALTLAQLVDELASEQRRLDLLDADGDPRTAVRGVFKPILAPQATPLPPVTDPAGARAWLDTERATLVAVAGYTAARGWPGHAIRLSAIVRRYVETGGHYTDGVTIHTHARRAAREAGEHGAEAFALNSLGLIAGRMGRYPQAAEHLRQALALFRASGDRSGLKVLADARAQTG